MNEKNIYDFPSANNVRSFFKRFGKLIILIVAVLIILVFVFDSFYTIKEQEQAIVITFGKAQSVNTAGFTF